jgi:hypothetical protein
MPVPTMTALGVRIITAFCCLIRNFCAMSNNVSAGQGLLSKECDIRHTSSIMG